MPVEIQTRWFGCAAVEGGKVIASRPFPADREALLERWKLRREGHVAPEEEALVGELRAAGKKVLTSRDRRLAGLGVEPAFGHLPDAVPDRERFPAGLGRELLLEQARRDLAASWDPSVHLEEAVRALSDLDETLNLLGERLSSWWGRERPEEAAEEGAKATAMALREGSASPAPDPKVAPGHALAKARSSLAEVWLLAEETRKALEAAVEEEAPARFPNLCALLGPQLTAKMLSQAGGIGRLARLPASTVQVLGAERAFFEHLRGRGPPPRHGLLFLHPTIHTSPRAQRGKIARALAGKVAIAARRDLEGSVPLPELHDAFERRLADIRKAGARGRAGRPSERSFSAEAGRREE